MTKPDIVVVVQGGVVQGVHQYNKPMGRLLKPLTYAVVDWDTLREAEHPDDLCFPVVMQPIECDSWSPSDDTAVRHELAELRTKLVDDLVEQKLAELRTKLVDDLVEQTKGGNANGR